MAAAAARWADSARCRTVSCLEAMGKKGKGSTRLPSGSSSGALGGLSPLQDRLLQQRVHAYCKVLMASRRSSCKVADSGNRAMHTS